MFYVLQGRNSSDHVVLSPVLPGVDPWCCIFSRSDDSFHLPHVPIISESDN
jgi:hypothetical protein